MNILDRYIGQAVISGVALVLVVFVVLYEVFAFVGEVHNIGRADYTVWAAIQYSLFLIPQHIYELFPLTMLLGTMLGLGRLANSNELVVIRMAGISLLHIVASIMKTAMMLMLLAILIGEGIGPPLHKYAKEQKIKALKLHVNMNTEYGMWARDASTYINVKRVEVGGRLIGISLYQFDDDNNIQRQIEAAQAVYDGEQWLLKSVKETIYKNSSFSINVINEMKWKTLLDLDTVKTIGVPGDLVSIWMLIPIWELSDYIDYLKANDLEYTKYELVFWTKLFGPFSILAMVLLAVPFVFGSVRHISIGKQILLGFLVGLTFNVASRLMGQMGVVYGMPPMVSAMLPILVVLSITLWSYRRIR